MGKAVGAFFDGRIGWAVIFTAFSMLFAGTWWAAEQATQKERLAAEIARTYEDIRTHAAMIRRLQDKVIALETMQVGRGLSTSARTSPPPLE